MVPPNCVLTPEALLTAVLVNEPVTGIELKKDPKILQIPNDSISCVASTLLPLAKKKVKY